MFKQLEIGTYNLDHLLIEQTRTERTMNLSVYKVPFIAVVLGRGSDPEIELNVEACHQDNVNILKRPGGGCSVVLDQGNVIVSVVLPASGISDNKKYFDKLTDWLIGRLSSAGIDGVYRDGISDLVIKARKIGGSSIQRTRDYLYFSSTLLVDPDVELMERYLKHPPREPQYRRGRSHRDFVSSISSNFSDISSDDIIAAFKADRDSNQMADLLTEAR